MGTQVHPSTPKYTQVHPSTPKLTQVYPSRPRRPKLTQVDPSRPKLTYLYQTKSAKTILQPERRRREGQCLPDVLRSIIPCFGIFSFFSAFLDSFVFCVV